MTSSSGFFYLQGRTASIQERKTKSSDVVLELDEVLDEVTLLEQLLLGLLHHLGGELVDRQALDDLVLVVTGDGGERVVDA